MPPMWVVKTDLILILEISVNSYLFPWESWREDMEVLAHIVISSTMESTVLNLEKLISV